MAVVVAERGGLHAAATRYASAGAPPPSVPRGACGRARRRGGDARREHGRRDLRRRPARLRPGLSRGRASGRLARALPGRPDRLPPARVRDRAAAGCDEPLVRARADRGRPRAGLEPERGRRRQGRGHLPRRAGGARADHRHRPTGRSFPTAGRPCSTSPLEPPRRSPHEGPRLARPPRAAASCHGRGERRALSRRRRVPHRDPERRGSARARRGHRGRGALRDRGEPRSRRAAARCCSASRRCRR